MGRALVAEATAGVPPGGDGAELEVGVSLGIGDIPGTVERVGAHLAQGYRRIKLKIMPGHDLAVLDAVRAA